MPQTPAEFHKQEVLFGAAQRTSTTFRLSLPLDNTVREFARQQGAEVSTLWRHAMSEYLTARGVDPLLGTPIAQH